MQNVMNVVIGADEGILYEVPCQWNVQVGLVDHPYCPQKHKIIHLSWKPKPLSMHSSWMKIMTRNFYYAEGECVVEILDRETLFCDFQYCGDQ